MEMKICTKCKEELPATTEHFHKKKNGKYGISSVCIICSRLMNKEYRSQPEAKLKEQQRKKKYGKDPDVIKRRKEVHKVWYSKPAVRKKCINRHREYSSMPENKERIKVYMETYNKVPNNQNRSREKGRQNKRKHTELLTDFYIKNIIRQGSSLGTSDITPEMIETKRLIIQLKRELGLTHSTNPLKNKQDGAKKRSEL